MQSSRLPHDPGLFSHLHCISRQPYPLRAESSGQVLDMGECIRLPVKGLTEA